MLVTNIMIVSTTMMMKTMFNSTFQNMRNRFRFAHKRLKGIRYREVNMSGRVFRQYEDDTTLWIEVVPFGAKSMVEQIMVDFNNGKFK